MQTKFEKERIKEQDRENKANRRALMTDEEKEKMREKDRLRKG